MVRTMYLRRCFYKASLEAETLTFLSRCVRVSFCAVIKEKTCSPYLLYIWEMGRTTAMLQHGYSICVAYEKQKCQKLDAKVYVWIVCDTYR